MLVCRVRVFLWVVFFGCLVFRWSVPGVPESLTGTQGGLPDYSVPLDRQVVLAVSRVAESATPETGIGYG